MDSVSVATAIEPPEEWAFHDDPHERLRRVFSNVADGLYRFILVRVGGHRATAEDLLAEACCVAVQNTNLPEGNAACEAWLFGVARNLVRKHWRRIKQRPGHVSIDDAAGSRQLVEAMESHTLPVDVLTQKESVTRMMAAITSLPATDQRLVFDYYFDGRAQDAIAKELGVTAKSIETKLYRIRGRLRAILRDPERNEQ